MDNKLIKEISDKAIELMADWPLTRSRQKQFVLEYVANGFTNASEACRNAGYSKKTATKQANQLLSGLDKTRHIKTVVDALKEEYEKRQAELKIADGTEVLQYLTSLMRGEQTEQTIISVGDYRQGITDIEVSAKDRIKAAELLGKSFAMWTEKIDADINQTVVFVDDVPLDDDD